MVKKSHNKIRNGRGPNESMTKTIRHPGFMSKGMGTTSHNHSD